MQESIESDPFAPVKRESTTMHANFQEKHAGNDFLFDMNLNGQMGDNFQLKRTNMKKSQSSYLSRVKVDDNTINIHVSTMNCAGKLPNNHIELMQLFEI